MLVDTSVWIDHFRRGNAALTSLLQRAEVWSHPFVIGELACGTLTKRREILSWLATLPQAPIAEHGEVMGFVEEHRLMGSGVGWIDAHLLASARLGGVGLWSLDRPLALAARSLGLYTDPRR